MTDDPSSANTITSISGGVSLDADHINIGGDVVGHDKIVSTTYITGDQQYDVQGLTNPFLGLQSFTYADHAKYAGREKLIVETVAHLTAPDGPLALFFVTGASGSGKSSFVQAGVLPALEQHYTELSVKWVVFRPSRDPLAALSDAVWRQLGLPQYDAPTDFGDFLKAHTPPQQVNVIVIDQFEELFTQSNTQPRDALFNLLTQLPPFRSTRTHIIATMRADYLPELFALPALYEFAKHGLDLHEMSVDELRDAIQQPLRVTYPDKDKCFQAELVERLAADAAEKAAYLPLLQVTLEEIWRKGTLTLGAYTNLSDAIEQRADKVLTYQDYDAAHPQHPRSAAEQAAILDVCLNLVDVSLDDQARRDVRRRRSKEELSRGALTRTQLIDALTQARLLSIEAESDDPTHVSVDLIHETLLSNWDRLKQAIAERRHELRQRARFEQQLKEWIGQNRSNDYLLSGVRLAEARELEHRDDVALRNADAKDFVHCGIEREETQRQKQLEDARKLAEAEAQRAESEKQRAEEQTRAAANLKRVLAVVALLAIIAVLLGVLAGVFGVQSTQTANVNATLAVQKAEIASTAQAAEAEALAQRDEAQRQARVAQSRELAAKALAQVNNQWDLALLLSVEAYRKKDTAEARNSLVSSLQHGALIQSVLQDRSYSMYSTAFSPDGKVMAVGSENKTIILWDVSDPQAPKQLGAPLTGHNASVVALTFSAKCARSSETGAERCRTILASGSNDETIILWDVTDPRAVRRLGEPLTAPMFSSIAFSPDGRTLASGGCGNYDVHVRHGDCLRGEIVLWDVSNPQAAKRLGVPLEAHTDAVAQVAFSLNSTMLASGGCGEREDNGNCTQGEIILWNVSDPQAPQRLGGPLIGHAQSVSSVAFSPDGKVLASGSRDDTIILWDLQTARPAGAPLTGHDRQVTSVAFSPDGKTLVSGGMDRKIILWDVSNPVGSVPQPLREPLIGHTDSVDTVAFNPDGTTLVSRGSDGIILWDVAEAIAPLRSGAVLTGHTAEVTNLAFSPDGKTLASGSWDRTVQLWDMTNLHSLKPLGTPLTFLADSSVTFGLHGSLAFSPDGRALAVGTCIQWDRDNRCTGSRIHLLKILDSQGLQRLSAPLTGYQGSVNSIAFSPDGKWLASGGDDATIHLWDVSSPQDLQLLSPPLSGHTAPVNTVVFTRNGKLLASGSSDHTIILWDMSNPRKPQRLGQPLTGHTDPVWSIAFSPDEKTVVSSSDKEVILWDISNQQTPQPTGVPLLFPGLSLASLAYSSDGKTLAASSADEIILWDVSNPRAPQLLGEPLTSQSDVINALAFTPDGRTLASGDLHPAIVLWSVDPIEWQDRACRLARRNFTRAEWQQYMGDEPYRKTCDQWPLELEVATTPSPTPTP